MSATDLLTIDTVAARLSVYDLRGSNRSADGIVRLVAQAGRHGRAQRATATCRGHVSGVWLDDLYGQVLRRPLEAANRLRGLREQWLSAARRHEMRGRRVRAMRLRERAFLLGAALHELSALANATAQNGYER